MGLAAVVYVVLFIWLGIATLRNGHGWLFFFGIFFPILWIFGAFARPANPLHRRRPWGTDCDPETTDTAGNNSGGQIDRKCPDLGLPSPCLSGSELNQRSPGPESARRLARIGCLPWLTVAYAEVRLLNGDVFTVEGTLDEVESKLSDAARSGQSRLAWFTEYGTDDSVGMNPAHIASLKVSENSG